VSVTTQVYLGGEKIFLAPLTTLVRNPLSCVVVFVLRVVVFLVVFFGFGILYLL
tara:strand:+ start:1350 stop:1511 length:162 start_codon:yes stop_codon:yes gene_type:complete